MHLELALIDRSDLINIIAPALWAALWLQPQLIFQNNLDRCEGAEEPVVIRH